MELKEFIGKVVIKTYNNQRCILREITSPSIGVITVEPDQHGHHTCYCWDTINGDPFKKGYLVFEDPSLAEPFRLAYDAYCRSEDAYWEEYDYWMRRS